MAFNNITKHPTLWFDDGNVVLIAENTGFRVYRGLLARHSDIFRDMFSVPQPQTAAEDSFDGCPVVRMPDDSADDVAIVLGILYEDSESFYGQNYRIPFRTAAAALQLGTKYLFDAIRREALKRIAVCFPKDLKELHAHDHGGYFHCRACPLIWDKADPIAVFHFARRLALDDLIPAALYRCAHSMTIPQLFSAINNPDASYYSLSLKELEDCMEAREYLFKKNVALQTTFVNNLGPDCVHEPESSCDPTPCEAALSDMALECLEDQFMLKCDTFLDLRNWISSHSGNISEHSLCCNCMDHYISLYERRQAAVWAAFRNRFGSTPHDTQMDWEDMI